MAGTINLSAGIATFLNTTATFTHALGAGYAAIPFAASFYCSAAGHAILTDQNGVVVLEMAASAGMVDWRDSHFFKDIRPWLTPLKATTLSGGGKLRLYF